MSVKKRVIWARPPKSAKYLIKSYTRILLNTDFCKIIPKWFLYARATVCVATGVSLIALLLDNK